MKMWFVIGLLIGTNNDCNVRHEIHEDLGGY